MESFLKFRAFDGSEHLTEAACRSFERKNAHVRLVGLTDVEIDDVLAGNNPDLAEAIELVGARIARARIARGHLKRQPGEPAPKQLTHQGNGETGEETGEETGDEYTGNEFTTADCENVL